jgi:PBSX family phage portal protein
MNGRKAIAKIPFEGEVQKADGSLEKVKFNARVVEATPEMIERARSKNNKSKIEVDEEKSSSLHDQRIIPAVYDPLELVYLEEVSNVLRECVDSMVVNIEGFGHLLRLKKISEENVEKFKKAILEEKARLDNLFDRISPNVSFTEARKRMRRDLELTGNGFFEAVEDKNGDLLELNHVPSYQMRLAKLDKKTTNYKVKVVDEANDFSIRTINRRKRFRRYVQLDSNKKPIVWFKEYGDPRSISSKDGNVKSSVGLNTRATSIIHFRIYSPRTPYGIPRHIGRYVAIKGSRRSEEVNFFTLSNNHIPSMFILLENGTLTEGSITRLTELVESQVTGDPNYSKFIILEAEADMNDILPGNVGAAKLTIKSMAETQHSDEMFQKYDKNNQDKVRQAFRLPPIFVGRADDYTRACYSEDTETLTENGWKHYSEIGNGEKIATFNPETNTLEYHEPIGGVHLYDYDGPMYHFKSRNTDVCVTPDHKMWVSTQNGSYHKVNAEDISSRIKFRNSPDFFIPRENPEYVIIPQMNLRDGPNSGLRREIKVPIKLWVEFISAFVAGGGTTPEFVNGERRYMYNVRLAAKKERKKKLFSRLYSELKNLGFNVFNEYERSGGTVEFTLADKVLWRMLRDQCGCNTFEKRLPNEFLHYNEDLTNIMLETLKATNGTVDDRYGRTNWSYSSVSKELVDQVQILAVHAGHRVNVIESEPKREGRSTIYRASITPDKVENTVSAKHISKVQYSGKVYCFEVPNHLFVTRRGGRVSIHGNTASESRRLADEQIFNPERALIDDAMNRLLVNLGMRFHTFKTRTPNITDNLILARAMSIAEKSGGMTPRRTDTLMQDIFEGDLGPMPQGIDLDVPFTIQFAQAQNAMRPPGGSSDDGVERARNMPSDDLDWVEDFIKDILRDSD